MSDSLSFGGLLEGMKRLFPPRLLSGDGLERLLAVADRLPLCVIDRPFGFEFPLSTEAADSDFCVIAAPGSSLAAHYIRSGAAAPTGSAAQALGACLDRSAGDPDSFLSSRGGSVILEYDVPAQRRQEPPPPGIFFVPVDSSLGAARKLLDDPAAAVAELWAAAGLCADPAESSQVERVYAALSADALVVQAGMMPGRRQRAVRLVVHRIDSAGLPGLLDSLRWPGPVDAVVSVAAAIDHLTPPGVVLSLDVSAHGISPRLGLELFGTAPRIRIDGSTWQPLLERLTETQCCLPAKAEGLREWSRTERMLGPHGVYRVYQYINHIKAVVDADRIGAKAYVAMVVRRFDG